MEILYRSFSSEENNELLSKFQIDLVYKDLLYFGGHQQRLNYFDSKLYLKRSNSNNWSVLQIGQETLEGRSRLLVKKMLTFLHLQSQIKVVKPTAFNEASLYSYITILKTIKGSKSIKSSKKCSYLLLLLNLCSQK